MWQGQHVWAILCLFVDDFFIASTCNAWVDALVAFLAERVEIKDLGDLNLALGMEVTRDLAAGTLRVTQEKYIKSCLRRFGREYARTASTPCHPSELAGPNGQPLDSPLPLRELKEFQEMVGSAMYAAICTRFDILFAVGRCARHMVAPTRLHQLWIRRIFDYLAGTLTTGLCYQRPDESSAQNVLVGYSDSDYGGSDLDPSDSIKHKSTTGYCVMLNGAAVMAASRLQPIVAASTAEAEYYALGSATMGVLALRNLLHELNLPQGPTVIHEDNQACIKIATNEVCSSKTKHIAMKYHLVRSYIKQGDIIVKFASSLEQIADGLTRVLVTNQHQRFRGSILGGGPSTRNFAQ
jgi:hypothetical protein